VKLSRTSAHKIDPRWGETPSSPDFFGEVTM
jgi:hypothetical protein